MLTHFVYFVYAHLMTVHSKMRSSKVAPRCLSGRADCRFPSHCYTRNWQFHTWRSKDDHFCFIIIHFKPISDHPILIPAIHHSTDLTASLIPDGSCGRKQHTVVFRLRGSAWIRCVVEQFHSMGACMWK